MKLRLFSLIGAAVFSFTACQEVDIVDGRIPAEYLEQAQAIVGDYTGAMEREAITLSVRLDGDKLIMTSDKDLIGEGCESTIGDLTKVRVDKDDDVVEVEGATFAFDPNLCGFNVEGETLQFSIRERNGNVRLDASILAYQDWVEDCHIECGAPGSGCRRVCRWRSENRYLRGRFNKQ